MSKLKEKNVLWANLNAKVVDFVAMFKKKKSRIGQLEVQMTMLQEMLKKIQEGGGFMLYLQTMLHDFDLDLISMLHNAQVNPSLLSKLPCLCT